jgi:hypothetical protein
LVPYTCFYQEVASDSTQITVVLDKRILLGSCWQEYEADRVSHHIH